MEDSIKHFNEQFAYEPEIKNAARLARTPWTVVAGMGGSALAADLLRVWKPDIPLIIHRDYELPAFVREFPGTYGLIASSYSGNTEETLSAFNFARDTRIPASAITAGGILLEVARRAEAPYIEIPATGIQPRMSVGLQMKAVLKLLGHSDGLRSLGRLHDTFEPMRYMGEGELLAKRLRGYAPIIYASRANGPLSYVWKVQLNETGKIPAFSNVVPELNHNEMTSFDRAIKTEELSNRFHFIFLKDVHDNPRIARRMEVLEGIYKGKHLPVTVVPLNEADPFRKIFTALVTAAWTAYYLARYYDIDPENVPLVEEFKRRIR